MMCVSTQTRPCLILIQVSRFASHLNPGSISTPSSYGDVQLTSIQFPSHLHPSPKIHASPTSRSCLTLTHAPIFASNIHLSDVSSPSRSWKFHLSSIQVQSQTHPGLGMCISIPSRSCTTCITSLLHRDHVSPQHMSWYLHPTSIQVQKITSQLHPSPISPYSGLMMCTSTQSRSHLSPTQMSIFVFHLYPDNTKAWSRSRYLHLTSKEVPSHLHPGRRIRVSAPSRCHLTPIQVWKFASKLHLCFVPPPSTSRSHLISIQAQIFASHIHPGDVYRSCAPHIHPGPVSPASKFQYPYLTSTHVLCHFHPCPKFCVSSASMWHLTSSVLTSIQVMIFASQLHPCPISHQSTFQY